MTQTGDHRVITLEALEALYGEPYGPAIVKEIDHINPHYRKFIEAAPFFALATCGPEGLDCSPRTVIVVAVERVFYQCTKAIVRSKLWDPAGHVDRKSLPSAGTILAEISGGKIGGPEHDRGQPQRIKETLY